MPDPNVVELRAWKEGHETLCAERYRNLESRILEQKVAVSKLYNGAWWIAGTIIFAMAGGFFALFMKISDAGKNLVN